MAALCPAHAERLTGRLHSGIDGSGGDQRAEQRLGRSLVLRQTGPATGTILGPMLGGLLSDLFGIRASMVIAGSIILLSTLMVWLLMHERPVARVAVRTSPPGSGQAWPISTPDEPKAGAPA